MIHWPSVAENLLNLKPELNRVAQICHVDELLVRKISRLGKPSKSTDPNVNRKIEIIARFFRALALYQLTLEEPLEEVADRFGMPKGNLEKIKNENEVSF